MAQHGEQFKIGFNDLETFLGMEEERMGKSINIVDKNNEGPNELPIIAINYEEVDVLETPNSSYAITKGKTYDYYGTPDFITFFWKDNSTVVLDKVIYNNGEEYNIYMEEYRTRLSCDLCIILNNN